MAFNIKYKSSIKKDLRHISKQEAYKLIRKIESVLTQDPLSFPLLKGEFKRLRKFRSGNYRVIFTIKDKDVIVLKIGHRKDIYK